jgi:hypothetical protein
MYSRKAKNKFKKNIHIKNEKLLYIELLSIVKLLQLVFHRPHNYINVYINICIMYYVDFLCHRILRVK